MQSVSDPLLHHPPDSEKIGPNCQSKINGRRCSEWRMKVQWISIVIDIISCTFGRDFRRHGHSSESSFEQQVS